jgi:uncharacterized caspase-like protein
MPTRAISVHIGVNSVDPAAYAGWSGELEGCENDAGTMREIAEVEGFTPRLILTADATSQNVLAAIQDAAQQLAAGDTFLLTYAGHGGQVPNLNDDEEDDRKDETWVLWDRMLLDDELREAFLAFGEGVNIVVLSDSCHSGTVTRRYGGLEEAENAIAKRLFYENLSAGSSNNVVVPRPAVQTSAANARNAFMLSDGLPAQVRTRELPFEVNQLVLLENLQVYREVQSRPRSRSPLLASLISISGCADNQLSQEVNGAGVFTTVLNRTWANNAFNRSYTEFHRAIVSQMLPNQTPQLGSWGANPQELAERTPFNP